MAELHDLTALEQAAALRRREVSPVELTEHYLERVSRLSDGVGAFATVTAERARARARDAEARVGPDSGLLGVPTAVKDLNMTACVRTTFGSAAMSDFVPEVSDEVVLRLEGAGLVSLGKTTTPEFGSPCYTEPEGLPPACSPYAPDRMAGGSSGGAAAAVSAGLVPFAQGSDGGGSIRIPASCCGVFGLKPTRGRVSSAPMFGDISGLGVTGPITRSVRDAAAMLDVLAGPAVGEPVWAPPLPQGETFLGWCDRPPGRLRMARWSAPMIAEAEVHPDCLRAYDETTALLTDLGHEVEEVGPPLRPEDVPVFEKVWAVGTALAPVPPDRVGLLRPLTRWLAERGRSVSGPEFGIALGEMRRVAARVLRDLASYDVVLTPTLAQPPLPVGALRDDDDPAGDFEAQKAFTPYTAVWNITGMPAASLPLGWSADGLPVGAMLAARPAQEHLLLALCAQVEEAAPWVDRHPPCW